MARGLFVINRPISRSLIQQPPPPFFLNQTPPPPSSDGFDLNDKVTPSILLIIIVLAIIFFVSGVLHLLVRYLLRPLPNRGDHHDDSESVTALQGQLQQLFQLHDSGVDQSYIDTLPVFSYKAIIGVKDPFDCAVCLCEFEPEDRLRLLPKCSHAFHMDCIDTWLLSHSTCPICRGSLISDIDFSSANQNCSPIVFVLESGSHESYSEIDFPDSETSTNLDLVPLSELLSQSCEIERKGVEDQPSDQPSAEKVVAVKLGKYKNVDCVGEGSTSSTSNGNIDSRRCFSMGSFAYVMEENTNLHVPIRTPMKKQSSKKPTLPLNPGLKLAMSECGGDSRRFSFRFPFQQNVVAADDRKIKNSGGAARRTASEISLGQLETGGSEWGSVEEEIHSSNSLDSQQSFTRRTLRWLMGRQNKVVHSTFSSNV